MPQGFAVEEASSLEIIAAWTAPKRTIMAVEESPGWHVVGEYFLPTSTHARLDVNASVSHESLTVRVRLWDTTAHGPITGAVEISSLAGERRLGARVQLVGGRSYQVQAECVGSSGADRFASVETVTITD